MALDFSQTWSYKFHHHLSFLVVKKLDGNVTSLERPRQDSYTHLGSRSYHTKCNICTHETQSAIKSAHETQKQLKAPYLHQTFLNNLQVRHWVRCDLQVTFYSPLVFTWGLPLPSLSYNGLRPSGGQNKHWLKSMLSDDVKINEIANWQWTATSNAVPQIIYLHTLVWFILSNLRGKSYLFWHY